jgi:hypothetical protein
MIFMNILNERTGSAFTIKGEAVMLDRYGTVYPVIDNLMHPNPGTAEDEYAEIERTVDWLYSINKRTDLLDLWVQSRVADFLKEMSGSNETPTFEEVMVNVMFSDLYNPCANTVAAIKKVYNKLVNQPELIDDIEINDFKYSEDIANYLNENFLRVRAGGKLNPEGANAIYFRISSHGYDWHRVIDNFLWDVFGEPNYMPKRIWIGHDAETNPPETVLFDGTPQDLFDKFDDKVFEEYHKNAKVIKENINLNQDNINYKLNKQYFQIIKSKDIKYLPYK